MKLYLLPILAAGAALTVSTTLQAGDAAAGARDFKAKCAVCHSVTSGGAAGVGPNLFGVVGRKAGTQAAFAARYSPAMKKSGIVWSAATLKAYVANPAGKVPGNKMTFAGVKDPAQLDNIVTYLASLH
jgi:cytochrome c